MVAEAPSCEVLAGGRAVLLSTLAPPCTAPPLVEVLLSRLLLPCTAPLLGSVLLAALPLCV